MLQYPDVEDFQGIPLHAKGKLKKYSCKTMSLMQKIKPTEQHYVFPMGTCTWMQRKALGRLGDRTECGAF